MIKSISDNVLDSKNLLKHFVPILLSNTKRNVRYFIYYRPHANRWRITPKFWREISALICNFTCEIRKLPWQPSERVSVKMATKFQNVMNEDVRAQKDASKNLNTQKSTSRRILTGILSKNSELKPNLSSKRSRECRSSRSIRSRINMSKIQDC